MRAFPVSRVRFYAGLATALILSAAILYFGTSLLTAHCNLSWLILEYTGIPSSGTKSLEVFTHLGPVIAPDIPFPAHRSSPVRTAVLFGLALCGLIVVHRKYPLSRNFVVFLVVLLCAAGGVILFNPSFYFDAGMYVQIWLRGEVLVWILLPWVSAFLFIFSLPSVAGGVGWTLLIQAYALFWSALRLAFCLGVLHFTGILFLPLVWFCLGILFDLVYVLVFYSLALRSCMRLAVGDRRS